jgi:hypothetical protein
MVVNKYDDLSVISYIHFTLFQKPIKILFALLLVGRPKCFAIYDSNFPFSQDFH